jgi:hypothetical protein
MKMRASALWSVLGLLVSCGGGGGGNPATYSVSVTVTGLQAGKTVALQNNGADGLVQLLEQRTAALRTG